MRFISKFDFLGVSPRLNIGGDDSNKTIFGGMLSLVVISLLLLGSSYFMYLLFSRKNYSVLASDEFAPNSFQNYTNPEISFYLANRLGEFLPDADRLYNVVATHIYYKTVQNPDGTSQARTSLTFLKMEKCNVTRHFPKREDMWKNEKFLKDSYCLAPNQIANILKPYAYPDYTAMIFWVKDAKTQQPKRIVSKEVL